MTQHDINGRSANIPAIQTRAIYPSEINTARRCWRKWAFQYLMRAPRGEESPNQILGNETHELFDAWIKIGQPPIPERSLADDLLVAALPYLPAPRTGQSEADVKREINSAAFGNSIGAIQYGMRRDWFGRSEQVRNFAELESFGDSPLVLDLKTSSNPLKYGLWSREQWLDDTEAVLYMLGLVAPPPIVVATPGVQQLAFAPDASLERVLTGQELADGTDVVGARWVYMQTPRKFPTGHARAGEWDWRPQPGKQQKAYPSDIVLGRDALNRAHLKIIAPSARGIIELREQATCGGGVQPLKLPFNLDACNDFHRLCDFADRCKGHFPTEVLVSAGYRSVFEKGDQQDMSQPNFMGDFAPPPGAAINGHAPQQSAPAPQGYAPPPLPPVNAQAQFAPPPAAAQQFAPPPLPPVAAPAANYQPRVNPPENPYAQAAQAAQAFAAPPPVAAAVAAPLLSSEAKSAITNGDVSREEMALALGRGILKLLGL